jgi:O-antigen/teichoic acid export membrane protein
MKESKDIVVSKSMIVENVVWKFAEQMSSQVVSFVITIVLARILDPADYGIVAMLLVFITIANVFVEYGAGKALVQKMDADNTDFSSMLYFNVLVSIILYISIYISAPTIAEFYNQHLLTRMTRVLGLAIIIASVKTVLLAYVSRHMVFKKTFFTTFAALIISGSVGIIMAINDFGAWALIVQYLLHNLSSVVFIWLSIKWKPAIVLSYIRIGKLYKFAWKLQLAAILNTIYNESRNLIVGKFYSASDLAFLTRGQSFPQIISNNITYSISAVLFSASSKIQNDVERLKELSRKTIRITSYIMFPLMFGLAAIAHPLVQVLLTDKWIFSVPYLQIACFSYSMIIIQISVQDTINALGRSDVFLYMDIIRKIIGFSLLVAVYSKGVYVIALTALITGPINVIMTVLVSRKIYAYSIKEHIMDNIPLLVSSGIMACVVYSIGYVGFDPITTLLLQIPIGILIYFLLSKRYKYEGYELAMEYLQKIIYR